MAGVVLMHGHDRRGASLGRLAREAERRGLATRSIRYSYRRSLPAIVNEVSPQVDAFAAEIGGPVQFVTHSLGGLVARALLATASVVGRAAGDAGAARR